MASLENVKDQPDEIIESVKTAVQTILKEDVLEICDLGFGYVNYIFRAEYGGQGKDGSNKGTVIAKYAPPYMKCFGPEFPLTQNRLSLEYKTLKKFAEICPGSVPAAIGYDSEHSIVLMEDLNSFGDLRDRLINSKVDLPALHQLSAILGKLHNATHVANVTDAQFAELRETFRGELTDLSSQYVFQAPFERTNARNHVATECQSYAERRIYSNQSLLANVHALQQIFLTKQECLLHGDLHTGSVMVHQGVAKMIDLEFAFMGPCAWDLGVLLANYMISYHAHMLTPENNDAHRRVAYKMLDICRTTVEEYLLNMTARVGDSDQYVTTLMSEAAGFAGMELISRAIGPTPADEVKDDGSKELEVLQSGERLVQKYQRIRNIGMLLNIALMLSY